MKYYNTLGPCTGLKFRPRPGPQIAFEAQARPGPAAVVQTRAWPANLIMRPGPGPQQVCPGPARPATQLLYLRPRPEPAGSGPGHWPDHIVIPQKQQYYYCVRILISRDCLVVMFTNTCIFNVCVKSSMDKKSV